MRLLNVATFEIRKFRDDGIPPYVAASHRWADPEYETCLKDVQKGRNVCSIGYKKVAGFAQYMRHHIKSIEWLWIDTCCIDRKDAAELSESINSMFRWYREAQLCLAYLVDVDADVSRGREADHGFKDSQWFKRGWTLQELLAPKTVVFLDKLWKVVGNKGGLEHDCRITSIGPSLEADVSVITKIPEQVLHRYERSLNLPVELRLTWMDGRVTSREQDLSYALYGLFGVTPGANYGESREESRERLLTAIYRKHDVAAHHADRMRNIKIWLAPPELWSVHETARQRSTAGTGAWLLESAAYQEWKQGLHHHFWLYGKAGSGKTILCSTVVEDVRNYCTNTRDTVCASFYFSFMVTQTQLYDSFLRSILMQLGGRTPGLIVLQKAYNESIQRSPTISDLENMIVSVLSLHGQAFLILDGLDEYSDTNDARQVLLDGLEGLARRAPKLRLFVTSRDLPDIRESMAGMEARMDCISPTYVNDDVRRYVTAELSNDRRLRYLPISIKNSIQETICVKTDGMFQWAYCQLGQIKRLKSYKLKYIQQTLDDIPTTLDGTYNRMLAAIEPIYRDEAFIFLRWLAYARSPLTLAELAETVAAASLQYDGMSEDDNMSDIEGPLHILSGLVTVPTSQLIPILQTDSPEAAEGYRRVSTSSLSCRNHICGDTHIALAHFSVREYLESSRLSSVREGKHFHLINARDQKYLGQSCINYLMQYSKSDSKSGTKEDLHRFALLRYAAQSWFDHCLAHSSDDISSQVHFLRSKEILTDWLKVYRPDRPDLMPFQAVDSHGSGLYYASFLGLKSAVQKLIELDSNLEADEGFYGTALMAASRNGHVEIVQSLIAAGADVNQCSGHTGTALQAAACHGHRRVVELLINSGAHVNCSHRPPWRYGDTLQIASREGHLEVVQQLLAAGAAANTQHGLYGNALQAAASRGQSAIVEVLLKAGADANKVGGYYQLASKAASFHGHVSVLKILNDAGANGEEDHGVLWQHDIDPETGRDPLGRTLLHLSASNNAIQAVGNAIEGGYMIDQVDNHKWTPLHWASYFGRTSIVQLLLERGAKHSLKDWQGWTPYQVAVYAGELAVADTLATFLIKDGTYEATVEGGLVLKGYCDGCRRALVGIQHHCVECIYPPAFDLCFRCILDADALHPQHAFISTFRYPSGDSTIGTKK